MVRSSRPGVLFQPDVQEAFRRGISIIVEAVRPTLGPLPRLVVNQPLGKEQPPELLDSAGVIVRRIVQVKDRQADVGAMFLRHILFSVYEDVGDGVATTAVIFDAVFKQGLKFIAQGGNAMRLRYYLEEGMRQVLNSLSDMTMPVEGRKRLTALAKSLCYDPEMADRLGEMLDILGPYGHLEVSTGYSRGLDHQYYNGSNWPSIVLNDRTTSQVGPLREDILEPAILITDFEFKDAESVMPVVQLALDQNIHHLIFTALSLSDDAKGLLHVANQEPSRLSILAMKTPGSGVNEQTTSMVDMAILTGAKPLVKAAGYTTEFIRADNLGHSRLAWINQNFIGFTAPKGDARAIQRHVRHLEEAYRQAKDADDRKSIRGRVAKFTNGSAGLFVGGLHEDEIERRKELARRTIESLRSAMDTGILPGAGASLLACQKNLENIHASSGEVEELAAYRILSGALEAPLQSLLANAGYPTSMIQKIKSHAPDHCFDVLSGAFLPVETEGIFDVAGVQKAALRAAVTGAAIALTTDTIVQHRHPQELVKP